MDGCVGFPEVLRRLKANDARLPVNLTAELTRRCTFSCKHCYCRLPEHDVHAELEMTGAEWTRVLGEAADEGALFLLVTGGEPLLHPDFRSIWVTAKRLGFIPKLYTNASLVTPDMADFLAEWPPEQISVTLYAAHEETHRAVTGREEMLAKVLDAVELLKGRGLPVEVKGLFTRSNAKEFAEVRQLSGAGDGVFRWGAELMGTLEGSFGRPGTVSLSPAEIIELERSDPPRWREWSSIMAAWKPAPPALESPFRCRIGVSNVHVDPYGMMRACELVESVAYDLRRGSFREGWRREIPERLNRFPSSPGPCQTCELVMACRVCPAHALLSGQPANGPSEVHCELGRIRADAFHLPAFPAGLKH